MTDQALFDNAVHHAKRCAFWRAEAAAAGRSERDGMDFGPWDLTRRQCLVRLRKAQAAVVDLGIKAEIRAVRDFTLGAGTAGDAGDTIAEPTP